MTADHVGVKPMKPDILQPCRYICKCRLHMNPLACAQLHKQASMIKVRPCLGFKPACHLRGISAACLKAHVTGPSGAAFCTYMKPAHIAAKRRLDSMFALLLLAVAVM